MQDFHESSPNDSVTQRAPRAGLAMIGVVILVGVVGGLVADPTLDGGMSVMFVIVLSVVAVFEVFFARFSLLPEIIAKEGLLAGSPSVLGFAFAVVPPVFGVLAAVMTGRAVAVLPFAVIAAFAWMFVWTYLSEQASRPLPPDS